MSGKNKKNQKGRSFLKNFTKDYITRTILTDKDLIYKKSIDDKTMVEKLKEINEKVNYYIQQLNLIENRNIPYLSMRFSIELCGEVRMFLRNNAEAAHLILQVDDEEKRFVDITHLLDLYLVAGGQEFYNSDIENVNGKIVADFDLKEFAIMDIFIDIAMFNSFSFLKKLTKTQKKSFNKYKAQYYLDNHFNSLFDIVDEDNLDYYSFAFACHFTDENENICFDCEQYVQIWHSFLSKYFQEKEHIESSLIDQLQMRVDDHIPHDYYKQFNEYAPGTYFVFRINKDKIPTKRRKSIDLIFGKEACGIGDLCIVDLETAKNYFEIYYELFTELYIAAFKVVKQ